MKNPDTYICRHVRELHAYVPGEQPRNPDLIKLNTNENPYPPAPGVMEAVRATAEKAVRLYPDPASVKLRELVAREFGCAPEQVFIGNGSDEVLALCTRAFVENDGIIGCFDPSYSLYPVLSAIRDVRIDPVPLTASFEWAMPEGYRASMFFLTCPNAPTGMAFPRSRVESFCASFDGMVLIDEAYADFADDHFADLALNLPNVMISRSFSKSYSLAGMRAGFAIGSRASVDALNRIKDSYNVNAVTQAAAYAAFDDQAWMKANVAKIRATRERVAAALADRGYGVCPSSANFLWVKPPEPAVEVFERLRARNVLVRYFPGEKTGGYLRITIGTDDQMNAFLAAL